MKTYRLVIRTLQDVQDCLQQIKANLPAYLSQKAALITEVLIDCNLFQGKDSELEKFIFEMNESSCWIKHIFLENSSDEFLDLMKTKISEHSFEHSLQIISSNCLPQGVSSEGLMLEIMEEFLTDVFNKFFQKIPKQSYEKFNKLFSENCNDYVMRCLGCFFNFVKRSMSYDVAAENYATSLIKQIVVEFLYEPIHTMLLGKYAKLLVRQRAIPDIQNYFVSDADTKIVNFFESFNNKAALALKIMLLLEDQDCSEYLCPPSCLLGTKILEEKLGVLFNFSVCERALKKAESSAAKTKENDSPSKPLLERHGTEYQNLPGLDSRGNGVPSLKF